MQLQSTPATHTRTSPGPRTNQFPARAAVVPDPRVAIVDGYGYRVGVRDNMLCVTQSGSETRYPQAAAAKTATGLARLVVVSDDGYITGRAFAWLRRNDVAVIHCNREGNSNFMSGATASDARLYRQQVLAQDDMPHAVKGINLTRDLLTAKITGQHEILKSMGTDGLPRIGDYLPMLARASTLRGFLGTEGNAARYYWQAWESRVSVPWRTVALRSVPAHWRKFNGRAAQTLDGGYTTQSNQNATDFVNAMLNMAYKFGEIECVFACHAFGLHPGIGISHGQVHGNLPAMALDILEACRPVCDSIVLSYLDYGCGQPMGDNGKPFLWSKDAATEMSGGVCRLNKEVVYKLASAVSMAVAPHAMRWAAVVAKSLANSEHISVTVPFDPRMREYRASDVISPDVTAEDIIPDHIWAAVEPLIPVLRTRGKQADARRVLAGIILHELYGVPWSPKIDAKRFASWQACRRRLENWQSTGAWDAIRAAVTQPGNPASEVS